MAMMRTNGSVRGGGGMPPFQGDLDSPGSPRRTTFSAQTSRSVISTPGSVLGGSLDDNDKVRVVVRVRPMNEREIAHEDPQIVFPDPDACSIRVTGTVVGGQETAKSFHFNQCIPETASQEEMFNMCGIVKLLNSSLDGYAATVFAYGQTGSGKTYSMSGLEQRIEKVEYSGHESDGLIPRSLQYLFDHIRSSKDRGVAFTVRCSYAEIYNEQVYDLLNMGTGKGLQVRWNITNGFFVQDLFVVECDTLDDVLAVISEGHRNRRIGSHELNKDSSRSHSLLTVHLESESTDPDDGHNMVKYGKMVFVDLAGSERLKDTKSDGISLTETGAINKSLFTLGKVISALGDRKKRKKDTFVPYRDSKLTKLLMDSLGGNSMTLMVACCSPAASHVEETLSTLNYATRAKNIHNRPMIQMDPKEQLIFNLRQEVKLLQMENSYLRHQLELHGGIAPPSRVPGSAQSTTSRGVSQRSSGKSTRNSAGGGGAVSGRGAYSQAQQQQQQYQSLPSPHAGSMQQQQQQQQQLQSPRATFGSGAGYAVSAQQQMGGGGGMLSPGGGGGGGYYAAPTPPMAGPPPGMGQDRSSRRSNGGYSRSHSMGDSVPQINSGGGGGTPPGMLPPSGLSRDQVGRALPNGAMVPSPSSAGAMLNGGAGSVSGRRGVPSPRTMSAQSAVAAAGGYEFAGATSGRRQRSRQQNVTFAGVQKILEGYQREVERLKRENREVRARSSVAERGYRAVMGENERLCNKLEHLEEIFVQQSRQTPWPARRAGGEAGDGDGDAAAAARRRLDTADGERMRKLCRNLKSENEALTRRLEQLQRTQVQRGSGNSPGGAQSSGDGGGGSSGGGTADAADARSMKLHSANQQLQRQVEQLRRREMELLRLLEKSRRQMHKKKGH